MTVSSTTDLSIPKTQRAGISPAADQPSIVAEVPVTQPADLEVGQALVKLLYSGVCASDLTIIKDPNQPIRPCIAGHEGAGVIVAINDPRSVMKVGDRVGIKFIADSCNQCEFCLDGHDMLCPKAKYSGRHVNGTFQQYAVGYTSQLTPIPDGLDLAEAAPILCAGLTVYKALKESNAKPGQWVALPGAGGGLGSLAVQYAKYLGLNVIAVDSGEAKRKLTAELGADKWIDFKEVDDMVAAVKAATPDGLGPHAAVVTGTTAAAYETAMAYIRPAGTVVAVGLPSREATIAANVAMTVLQKKRLVGSMVGTRLDVIEALRIVAEGHVKVTIQIRPFDELQKTYDEIIAGTLPGRVVLDLSK